MVKITSKGDMNVKNIAAAEGGSTVTQNVTEGPAADARGPVRKAIDAALGVISGFVPWLK